MDRLILAREIRKRRLNRSLSQMQLADMAQVSIRTIQRLEKTGQCSHETLLALADVFDVEVSEFTFLLELSNQKYMNEQTVKSESSWPGKIIMIGSLFVCLVAAITIYLALRFSNYYHGIDRTMVTGNADYLIALKIAGGFLALYAAVFAAYVGLVKKVVWGMIVFAGSLCLVAVSFSFLPWIYYPYDQYSAGAAWVFSWLLVMITVWVFVVIAGRWIKSNKVIMN